jgi:hypothetical protein
MRLITIDICAMLIVAWEQFADKPPAEVRVTRVSGPVLFALIAGPLEICPMELHE